MTLAGYSALLAGGITLYVDVVLGALVGHTWQLFGTLWLYAMAVGGARRPAAVGVLLDVQHDRASGRGVSLLRSVVYFGGNGAQTPLLTLVLWGAAGCLLATLATAARVNYLAVHEHLGRRRDLLRPRVLSPAD